MLFQVCKYTYTLSGFDVSEKFTVKRKAIQRDSGMKKHSKKAQFGHVSNHFRL